MENKTYKFIKEYINKNKDILTDLDIKILSKYAYEVCKQNIENVNKINKKDIIDDLNYLNNKIKDTDNTSILKDRLTREVEILNKIYNNEDIDDISFELDKLFLSSDLPVREKSNLIYKLKKDGKVKTSER